MRIGYEYYSLKSIGFTVVINNQVEVMKLFTNVTDGFLKHE